MNIHMKIDELKRQGFVNLGPSLLSETEINELCTLSKNTFEETSQDHPDYLPAESGARGIRRLPQHHPRIAELLDQVVTNSTFKRTLENLLGSGYKISQVNMRESSPGDRGLYLHQDAPGEFGVIILLSDNANGCGATALLPCSHLVPRRIKDFRVEIPPSLLMFLRFLFTPLTGNAGDVCFFFHRIWHGRFSNQSSNAYDAIFISFFPAGHCLGYEECGDWSSEFLSAIRGTELGRLIDPSVGTEPQSDGSYKILSSENITKTTLPYVLGIEVYQGAQHRLNNFKLSVSIIVLRLIMGIARPSAHLFRKMTM